MCFEFSLVQALLFSLAQMQVLRVLLTIFLPHRPPVLSPYPSVLYHLKHQPNLSYPLTQSLGWIINQEKSELKPTQVFSFMEYEYHLDSALVKPTQERWLKLQVLIQRLKLKHVLTARCLMSLIGLLASTEKMVPEGRLHMRPFQFHLKEHWRYPQ